MPLRIPLTTTLTSTLRSVLTSGGWVINVVVGSYPAATTTPLRLLTRGLFPHSEGVPQGEHQTLLPPPLFVGGSVLPLVALLRQMACSPTSRAYIANVKPVHLLPQAALSGHMR